MQEIVDRINKMDLPLEEKRRLLSIILQTIKERSSELRENPELEIVVLTILSQGDVRGKVMTKDEALATLPNDANMKYWSDVAREYLALPIPPSTVRFLFGSRSGVGYMSVTLSPRAINCTTRGEA